MFGKSFADPAYPSGGKLCFCLGKWFVTVGAIDSGYYPEPHRTDHIFGVLDRCAAPAATKLTNVVRHTSPLYSLVEEASQEC